MSVDIQLLMRNGLYGITGTGGQAAPVVGNYLGSPYGAVVEDADRPLSNILIPSRFRFWRTSISPPGTVYVDLVGQSTVNARQAGVAMIRKYRGAGGFTGVNIYSGSSAPASTLRLALSVNPATQNDVFGDIGSSVTAAHWRFEFTGVVGQFSCKPWLVRSLDTQTLNQGMRAMETWRRVREDERVAFLGGKLFNDLGIGVAARLRDFKVPITALSATQVGFLRTIQKGNFVYKHFDGNYYECRISEPEVNWQQFPGPSALNETLISFTQVP